MSESHSSLKQAQRLAPSPGPRRRVRLACLPTPLERLDRLSRHLSGPEIFVKRDDMTGLAFGGNKARKLEYLAADALARKATTLVTVGAAHSNHARMTAAAANRLGMKCAVVLGGRRPTSWQGNELLCFVMGARMRHVDDAGRGALEAAAHAWFGELEAQGERPYFIPMGGSCGLGALGYVAAARELLTDFNRLRLQVDAVYVAVGSGGTFAGLAQGLARHARPGRRPALVGVSIGSPAALLRKDVASILRGMPLAASARAEVDPSSLELVDRHIGERYGAPSPEGLEAIRLTARTEGLLLDPVYTGKAMAGLIADVREGRFRRGRRVLFLHTGGLPGLFAHGDSLAATAVD